MSENSAKPELILEGPVFDSYILYQFLKKLTTPFNQTDAFKLGIIDDAGNVLRKRSSLTKPEEKSAFTIFDLLINNLKKIIAKAPGGKSMIASYIAALFLIREEKNASQYQDEDTTYEAFMDFFERVMSERKKLRQVLSEARFSKSDAKRIGALMDVDWADTDLEQFRRGLEVESEHNQGDELDVVNNNKDLAKIVLAHLKELPNYYDKLDKMEEDAPANVAGSGNIAGLIGDPVVRRKKKKFGEFAK